MRIIIATPVENAEQRLVRLLLGLMVRLLDTPYQATWPPENPWNWGPQAGLPLSRRALRILALQGLRTVAAIAKAVRTGVLNVYPVWLQDEVQHCFGLLEPALTAWTDRRRIHWHECRARLRRLDWQTTVVGRALTEGEAAGLAQVDVRRLDCAWVVKNPVIQLGATDALDAAICDRTRLLKQRDAGPKRIERLRMAVEQALGGQFLPDWWSASCIDHLKYAAAGRALSLDEVRMLQQRDVRDLKLSRRATRAIDATGIETCLDMAALSVRELWFIPGCGHATFLELRRLVHEQCRGVASGNA